MSIAKLRFFFLTPSENRRKMRSSALRTAKKNQKIQQREEMESQKAAEREEKETQRALEREEAARGIPCPVLR